MKKRKDSQPERKEVESLRESYEKAVDERDKAEAEKDTMSKTIDELKQKLGSVENALGGLVSNLQHEVDVREAKIHKLEDEVEVIHSGENYPHDVPPLAEAARDDDHALSHLEWGTQPKKSYSPDRSFEDLLEESRKRKEQWEVTRKQNTGWDEEEANEVRSSTGMKWLLALGGVAVVGIGVSAVLLWLSNGSAAGSADQSSAGNVGGASGDQMEKAIEQELKEAEHRKEEITKVLKEFLLEDDLEAKAAFCYQPRRTLAHMAVYYEKHKDDPRDFESIKVSERAEPMPNGRDAWRLTIKHEEQKEPRVTFVYKAGGGGYEIDWETYVRYQEVPWEEFLDSHSLEYQNMHVLVGAGADEHPDYPADEYYGVRIRGWEEDAYRWSLAFIAKDHPDAQAFIGKMNKVPDSVDAHGLPYRFEHYILRVRHANAEDDPLHPLMIGEIISDNFNYPEDLPE